MPHLRLAANKQTGVCYAITVEGLELPVIDITHPAFAEAVLTDADLQARFLRFLTRSPFRRLPKFLRQRLMARMMRGSLVGQVMQQARGTFVSGTSTYIMKLGPGMLGTVSTRSIDRHIAQGPSLLAMRLRLRDMAHYLADTVEPLLAAGSRLPLQFVDVAGGPAADAWNALLLLHQRQPGLLNARAIAIDVFDQDEAGPAFGQAAVAALCEPAHPLQGLAITFRRVPYDWRHTAPLEQALATRATGTLTLASTEGGLFEYGEDEAIVANLTALRQAGSVIAVAGTFAAADELSRKMRADHGAAVHPRSVAAFAALAARTGWKISRLHEVPLSNRVLLTPE